MLLIYPFLNLNAADMLEKATGEVLQQPSYIISSNLLEIDACSVSIYSKEPDMPVFP